MKQAGRPTVHGSIFTWTKRFSFFSEALRQAMGPRGLLLSL